MKASRALKKGKKTTKKRLLAASHPRVLSIRQQTDTRQKSPLSLSLSVSDFHKTTKRTSAKEEVSHVCSGSRRAE